MIEELIGRLLKEVVEEANHKGWCDKEMTMAEYHREKEATKVKELNTQLPVGEGHIGKPKEQISATEANIVTIGGEC